MFTLIPRDVGVHFTRAPMPDRISVETLRDMSRGIAAGAAQLLPDGDLDVICYSCTSGSIVIGEAQVVQELRRGAPAVIPTTLVTCVVQALHALSVKRLVVGTPYVDEINELERTYLREAGFEVVDIQGLHISRDSDMARVSPHYLQRFAAEIDRPDADALFLSCSALRSVEIIEDLERLLGKPVVTSNQAMAWHTMRLAGIADCRPGFGRLLREH